MYGLVYVQLCGGLWMGRVTIQKWRGCAQAPARIATPIPC